MNNFSSCWGAFTHSLYYAIFRGDLFKALKERYFHDAKDNVQDFEGWKPYDVNEVKAKTWESVDITCLSPILVIGVNCIVHHLTDEGTYTATKQNDNFDFPVVRST